MNRWLGQYSLQGQQSQDQKQQQWTLVLLLQCSKLLQGLRNNKMGNKSNKTETNGLQGVNGGTNIRSQKTPNI